MRGLQGGRGLAQRCAPLFPKGDHPAQDLSGLYTSDEMAQAENEATVDAPQQQAVAVEAEPVEQAERPTFDPAAAAAAVPVAERVLATFDTEVTAAAPGRPTPGAR